MKNEPNMRHEPLSPEEVAAKAAILGECEKFAAACITFVAVHFNGSGDSSVTEEVKCFESDYYAYDEHEPVDYEATHLQEHFEALVPFGYENDCGGFGDVVLEVDVRKITVEATTGLKTTQPRAMRFSHGPSTETHSKQRPQIRRRSRGLPGDSLSATR